jgi:hypothetical protein
MYFDRLLFSAAFVTLLATAALALVPAETPNAAATTAATAEPPALPSLERVVVIGKKEGAARS